MILDTQFLIRVAAEDPDALAMAREMQTLPNRIPTGVVFEIFDSVGRGADPVSNQRAHKQLLSQHPVVDLTEDIARRAGVLHGTHAASDEKRDLDGVDAMVAATGLALNEPVVSNDSDFQDVDGLAVETY
jgi:tRNA(fMet)-specific endonuclease VapC